MPQTRSQYQAEIEAKLRVEMEAKLQAKMQQFKSTPLKDATQFTTGMPPHIFTPQGYTIGESSSQ